MPATAIGASTPACSGKVGGSTSKACIGCGGNAIEGTGDHNTLSDNDLRDGAGGGILLTGSRNVLDSNDVSRVFPDAPIATPGAAR